VWDRGPNHRPVPAAEGADPRGTPDRAWAPGLALLLRGAAEGPRLSPDATRAGRTSRHHLTRFGASVEPRATDAGCSSWRGRNKADGSNNGTRATLCTEYGSSSGRRVSGATMPGGGSSAGGSTPPSWLVAANSRPAVRSTRSYRSTSRLTRARRAASRTPRAAGDPFDSGERSSARSRRDGCTGSARSRWGGANLPALRRSTRRWSDESDRPGCDPSLDSTTLRHGASSKKRTGRDSLNARAELPQSLPEDGSGVGGAGVGAPRREGAARRQTRSAGNRPAHASATGPGNRRLRTAGGRTLDFATIFSYLPSYSTGTRCRTREGGRTSRSTRRAAGPTGSVLGA